MHLLLQLHVIVHTYSARDSSQALDSFFTVKATDDDVAVLSDCFSRLCMHTYTHTHTHTPINVYMRQSIRR